MNLSSLPNSAMSSSFGHLQQSSAPRNDDLCVALLGMAETLRTSVPPRYRLTIKCLKAMFNVPMSPELSIVAHFHLGKTLYHYTKNVEEAKVHLEQAYARSLNGFDEIRVQIGSVLAQIYVDMKTFDAAKMLLRNELDVSRRFSFWHCRILFQLANICVQTDDNTSALTLLEAGAEFCMSANVVYMEALFRLTKGTLILMDAQRRPELSQILERGQTLVSAVGGSVTRKEELKAFFLVLQFCYFMTNGAVKSAKPCLKQLQLTVQDMTSHADESNVGHVMQVEMFRWLPKEHITTLVYLLTVIHSLQSGQMDRVQKYAERALGQIEKLKQYCRLNEPSLAVHQPLLASMHVMLLENSCMGHLVVGRPCLAIKEIKEMTTLFRTFPYLLNAHEAQCHALIGLYAVSVKCCEAAENQFNSALRTAKDMDLWTFVNLNLAVVYLQAGRDQDFYGILERITPERLQSSSQTLLAASHYVRGLQSFLQSRHQEAKRYLKDSLAISNKEDIMRISAAALVLLGHIFLRSSVQECSSMLSPALELANKIPDVPLQAWATNLLKDVYLICGDNEKANESKNVSDTYSNHLNADRRKAIQSSCHCLVEWTNGNPPVTSD